MQDLPPFISFLKTYFKERIVGFGLGFESIKNVIVAFLIVKRGKYSTSFLNISFFFLIAATMIGGPAIAENNPFINSLDQSQDKFQSVVVAYNPYESSLTTIESPKPRDKVEDYMVKSGDTLASIGKKFGVSVDSIKWASNIKTDTITPGQKLQVPPVTGVVHKVTAGENIYTIAKKYSTDPQKIVNFIFNDFADLDTFALTPGQTLVVPDGIPEEEKPRVAPSSQFAQIQAGVKGAGQFIWPTSGTITQYYVWYHQALDIANASSPPIIAADTGTVVYAGFDYSGYGNHIIIDHGNGYQTLYGHLSYLGVSAGQAVTQGERIGTMGSTGRSTGTHLHFEIRSGGALLNPLNFLQ